MGSRKIRYTVQKVDGRAMTLCENCRYAAAAATISTRKVGEYLVTLNVQDNAGFYGKNGKNNAATPVSKAILIRDTVKPKITVAGKSAVVQCGKTYKDAGASAVDTLDGKLKVTTSSNVDTRKVGKYTVTYSAADKAGNKAATKSRSVKVVDTKKPVISLIGDKVVVHHVSSGAKFVDAGVKTSDSCPGALKVKKTWSPEFSAHTVGTYRLTYTVSDTAGLSSSVTRIYKVVDDVKPIISITGADDITLEASNTKTYSDKGAKCADTSSEKPIKVEATGDTVQMNTPGTYQIIYNCEDLNGNAAVTVSRKITVRDTTAPKITLRVATSRSRPASSTPTPVPPPGTTSTASSPPRSSRPSPSRARPSPRSTPARLASTPSPTTSRTPPATRPSPPSAPSRSSTPSPPSSPSSSRARSPPRRTLPPASAVSRTPPTTLRSSTASSPSTSTTVRSRTSSTPPPKLRAVGAASPRTTPKAGLLQRL